MLPFLLLGERQGVHRPFLGLLLDFALVVVLALAARLVAVEAHLAPVAGGLFSDVGARRFGETVGVVLLEVAGDQLRGMDWLNITGNSVASEHRPIKSHREDTYSFLAVVYFFGACVVSHVMCVSWTIGINVLLILHRW